MHEMTIKKYYLNLSVWSLSNQVSGNF